MYFTVVFSCILHYNHEKHELKIKSIGTVIGAKQVQNTHVFDTTAGLAKWRHRRHEDCRQMGRTFAFACPLEFRPGISRYLLYYEGRVKRTISPKLRVRIKDNDSSPHGKFYRFLFPFSSKFPDLKFASYVLYVYPCDTHNEPGLPVIISAGIWRNRLTMQ